MGVIVTDYAYHGNTAALWQVSPLFAPTYKRGPNVRTVPAMDPYREGEGMSEEELASRYAEDVRRAIVSFTAEGIRVAGLLFCTCFSSEGLPTVPPGFMPKALAYIRAAGGLFIADEVQAGFGRLGTHMWGHQKLGVVPDLVTLGKPMGNGHPLAAVVTRAELCDRFTSETMYFNTFGGNAVSAEVGMAVLQVLQEEGLITHAQQVGEYTCQRLSELKERHSLVGDVRGSGLFFAVELVRDRGSKAPAPEQTKLLVNRMREHGVLISRVGPHGNVLKIRPPMVFRREHADLLVDVLDRVLGTL
jgi:4-aminobutyrate aminotransferase-like enzyme